MKQSRVIAVLISINLLILYTILMNSGGSQGGSFKEEEKTLENPNDKINSALLTVLHTVAASMQNNPTDHEISAVRALLNSLSELYPWQQCEDTEGVPPVTSLLKRATRNLNTRIDVVIAICDLHNSISAVLGKEEMRCELQTLDGLWKKDCNCPEEDTYEEPNPEEPMEDSEII